jgi:hypothetical protein
MAGTLTISTLSDGTNSTSATNPIKGSAKAWLNYNAITQTVKGSFNISSVTYNSTGNYTLNFTTAMANANYAPVISQTCFSAANTGGNAYIAGTASGGATLKTTTQLMLTSFVNTTGVYDYAEYNCIVLSS